MTQLCSGRLVGSKMSRNILSFRMPGAVVVTGQEGGGGDSNRNIKDMCSRAEHYGVSAPLAAAENDDIGQEREEIHVWVLAPS